MALANTHLIKSAAATTGAGTSEVDGAGIDMAGYEEVLFIAKFGTAASGNTLQAQQSEDDSSYADLEDTLVDVGSSDEIVWLNLIKPAERYVRIQVQRGTSTTLDWAVAILGGAHKLPVDNTVAGTIAGEIYNSPAEGTP